MRRNKIRFSDDYNNIILQYSTRTHLRRGDNWKRRAGKLVNKNISPLGFLRPKRKAIYPPGVKGTAENFADVKESWTPIRGRPDIILD